MVDEVEDKSMEEKLELLQGVKKECKKLMEEAVTKKFIHTDSSAITSLCSSIECCLVHRLKKRAGGLLPALTNSDDILCKLSKLSPEADRVLKISTHLQQIHEMKQRSLLSIEFINNLNSPEKKHLNGYTHTSFSAKYLWIRLALLEKVLTTIIATLIKYSSDFYDAEALLADNVHARSFVWLLDGPSSLDFSKMKTPDSIYYDPTAYELVQRHRIYSSSSISHGIKLNTKRRRLFTVSSVESGSTVLSAPFVAREHVESLHQNAETTLLYGKNNVVLELIDFPSPIQGYLSLHKTPDSLLLKWTPNPMLHENDVDIVNHKNEFWDQAVTINLVDVVYIHCHDAGASGGSIVLISQDGVQLPPLLFPTGGSVLSFLTCLEQGLNPDGRLDPPLFHKQNPIIAWPKLKKTILPDKLMNVFQDSVAEETKAQDFVFRVVSNLPASSIDKVELKKLLFTGNSLQIDSFWKNKKKPFSSKMHAGWLNRSKSVSSRVALDLACEKMKHQILTRAFNGWISSYRHLKTVRTHLATLVLPWSNDDLLPVDVEKGLTREVWERIKQNGIRDHVEEMKQYVYYGGVEHSIRHEVWPCLLDNYSFNSYPHQLPESDDRIEQSYYQVLEECKAVEKVLQEKERDLLALNGFANGETFYQPDSCKNGETPSIQNSNEALNDNISADLSLTSNTSDTLVSGSSFDSTDSGQKPKEFSLIKSLLETKDSLRDMVEVASARGASAWEKLMKSNKKAQRAKSDTETIGRTFDALSQEFIRSPDESFDLELECKRCGKKIIESRQSVIEGKLREDSMESVECFSCTQERMVSEHYDEQVSQFKVSLSPSAVVYDSKVESRNNDGDFVVINGEGTPLQKRFSMSSIGSCYSEDLMKDFALNIHRIDKDVLRCDRNHPYFESEKNLNKLRNVIMCYVWERLNIGYIQGMCDLCAPFLVIIDDEAKVFSCFVKLMNRMTNNFPHGSAMDLHLSNIGSLIQILDPQLHEILEVDGDSTIFYFCYRWFLLDLKRELKYEDVFLVWETIWAAKTVSSENFNLFVALAIIELYRDIIIDNQMDFTDIIKFFNEMAEQHDVKATLNLARNIVRKLQDIMHPGDADVVIGRCVYGDVKDAGLTQ